MTTVGSVISYPIPAYQNVPIQSQFYIPSRFVISNITLGQTTTVQTSVNHNFVVGQLIRLLIPPTYGCTQLNNSNGYVISIPSLNQVEVDIYSLGGNNFFASSNTVSLPQILAIGDVNTGVLNSSGISSTGTFIPGSFINISPS